MGSALDHESSAANRPYPGITFQRVRNKRVALLGACVLAVMALIAYLIWSGYREEIRSAETTSRGYSAVIEAQLDATLRRADTHLQELARGLPVAALRKQALPRYAREINARLDLLHLNFPELAGLRVFDANGDQLYSSYRDHTPRGNVADRDYFRHARDEQTDYPVFQVAVSRTTGRQALVVARALRGEQGTFRGIAIATVDVGYFQKLFQSLDIGARGVVAIYRTDDFSPVMRWPTVQGGLGKTLPPGTPTREAVQAGQKIATVEFAAVADGVWRIYGLHVVDHYPFFVAVGIARDDALAGWRERSLAVGLSAVLFLGLLLGLVHRLGRTEAALSVNEELMRSTFEQAAVGIAHIAPGTFRILIANDKFGGLLGYTRDELIGTDSRRLTPPGDLSTRQAERERLLTGKLQTSTSERQLLKKDGTLLWVERSLSLVRDAIGKPQYFISVIVDISGRKVAEEQIHNLAFYDPLTRLPNRRLLHDRCEQALRTCSRHKSHGAVLFLDLDRFKALNDSKGHDVGDMLLIEVARRLLLCVRAEDTVARMGGDEFIVVLEELSPDAEVATVQSKAVAEKIQCALDAPYVLNGHAHNSSTSIGICLFNGGDQSVGELLMQADRAMYQAKAAGGNTVRVSGE